MLLDDLTSQQSASYQSPPEPIPTAQMVYSPPALPMPQLHQGAYQQPTAQQPSQDTYSQPPTTQLHQGTYQQPTGHLHQGAYQQPAAPVHQAPYLSKTVSSHIDYFSIIY